MGSATEQAFDAARGIVDCGAYIGVDGWPANCGFDMLGVCGSESVWKQRGVETQSIISVTYLKTVLHVSYYLVVLAEGETGNAIVGSRAASNVTVILLSQGRFLLALVTLTGVQDVLRKVLGCLIAGFAEWVVRGPGHLRRGPRSHVDRRVIK
jgi:hypothetical protein